MIQTIKFTSSTELAPEYAPGTTVANTETDAIIVLALDVDPDSVAEAGGNTQATLYINSVKGSLTNTQIRIYCSYINNPTASDWYQEVVETDTSGVATLDPLVLTFTADAKVAYHFPIGAYKALKVTVGSTGTITGSSITLNKESLQMDLQPFKGDLASVVKKIEDSNKVLKSIHTETEIAREELKKVQALY